MLENLGFSQNSEKLSIFCWKVLKISFIIKIRYFLFGLGLSLGFGLAEIMQQVMKHQKIEIVDVLLVL